MDPITLLILQALKLSRLNTQSLEALKHRWSTKFKSPCPGNIKILEVYRQLVKTKKIKANKKLTDLLKKQKTRTLSGIAAITVLTKPYPCPGHCVYCPTEKKMPKSYLPDEP